VELTRFDGQRVPFVEKRVRCAGGELFDTLWEAQVLLEQWRREYNAVRPHSALGYRPPAPEAWSLVATRAQIGALRAGLVIEKLHSCVVPS